LLLLSKHPINDGTYTPFETKLIKRGVISAEIAGSRVQCTHMSADLSRIPYPTEDARYSSWEEEHLGNVQALVKDAGNECTALMGDLNAGPANTALRLSGELEANFEAMQDAGYVDQFDGEEFCTHCSTNPLVGGSHSSRIDHVLFKNCEGEYESSYMRAYDEAIGVTTESGAQVEGALSDHYGVSVFLTRQD
jgi:endonuclease/exonuclease/phosphatase family metal-dependent hydrolase